jgi:hypothetical protein
MFGVRAGLLGGGSTPSIGRLTMVERAAWRRNEVTLKGGPLFALRSIDPIIRHYETNKPLLGNAFCPHFGNKGASARLASCSRSVEGL